MTAVSVRSRVIRGGQGPRGQSALEVLMAQGALPPGSTPTDYRDWLLAELKDVVMATTFFAAEGVAQLANQTFHGTVRDAGAGAGVKMASTHFGARIRVMLGNLSEPTLPVIAWLETTDSLAGPVVWTPGPSSTVTPGVVDLGNGNAVLNPAETLVLEEPIAGQFWRPVVLCGDVAMTSLYVKTFFR